MLQNHPKHWFERILSPYAFLLGVGLSFLGSCVGGFVAGGINYNESFQRFHELIGPENYCYPTASQVRAIAKSRLKDEKIAVVIGGNSILYGTGQNVDRVWTKELQK